MIQSMAYCKNCRLSAVVVLKFGVDGAHVITDYTLREVKFLRDISVGKSLRDRPPGVVYGRVYRKWCGHRRGWPAGNGWSGRPALCLLSEYKAGERQNCQGMAAVILPGRWRIQRPTSNYPGPAQTARPEHACLVWMWLKNIYRYAHIIRPPNWQGVRRVLKFLSARPHRLAVQDIALSRLKQGFDSPWGYFSLNAYERKYLLNSG